METNVSLCGGKVGDVASIQAPLIANFLSALCYPVRYGDFAFSILPRYELNDEQAHAYSGVQDSHCTKLCDMGIYVGRWWVFRHTVLLSDVPTDARQFPISI